jgi:PAS domain S-box-containing protein
MDGFSGERLGDLGIGPFRHSAAAMLVAVPSVYWPALLLSALAVAGLIAAVVVVVRLNRRLASAEKLARDEQADRERSEQSLRWSQDELRLARDSAEETATRLRKLYRAVEQNPASILIANRDGSIEYVNPGFVKTTGYSAEEVIGKNPRILQSGVHSRSSYQRMWNCLLRKEVWRGEFCNRKKNGELYWEDATIAPIVDQQGDISHYVAVKIDVTARKQGELALKETNEQLQKTTAFQRALLNSAGYAIVAMQTDGTIMVFNAGAERMLGYRAEEVVGKVGLEFFHDRNEMAERAEALSAELGFFVRPGGETLVAKVRPGQLDECEWTYVRKDGTRLPGLLSMSAIYDSAGQVTGFMGIIQDITERKRAEEALLASEHRYRLLAENMRDVVWTADMNLNRTYVSPSVVHLTGHTAEEALQLPYDEVLSPQSTKDTREVFMRIMAEARTNPSVFLKPTRHEMEYRCKEGGTVWAEANMTWLLGKGGTPIGGMGVSRDITARKKAAQELQEYACKLEEANRELAEATMAAQAASKAKDQFLAIISHELRTPLNGVIGMTELLKDTQLDDRQRAFVEACQSSGRSLMALINDILDFSKIEAGKLELDHRDFELGRLVEEIAETMAFHAQAKGIQLVRRVDAAACRWVRGDDVRVRQILINLIGNAIKFTEVGEVAVSVSLTEERDGLASARFEVADTGIGIPADGIDRLFKSFSQADSSTTRKYGGTGLGLAISKRLVELMGGQIGVRSQPGEGSMFWFVVPLPLAANEPAPQKSSSAAPDARQPPLDLLLKGRRILLAEDNRVNRLFAQEILRQAGAECLTAENGRQALLALENESLDLVLMDCQMPEMDGFEATRQIRQMESEGQLAGHVPIIALTANAVQGDRQRCLEVGMDDYISKPFEPDKLLEMVERLLAAHDGQSVKRPAIAKEPLAASREPSPPVSGRSLPMDREALMARCMGNLEFAQSLLSDFERDLADRVDQLSRNIEQRDANAITDSAHALKGAAGMATAESMRALAAEIEAAGKTGNLADIASLAQRLHDEAGRCLHFIPELREQMAAP